jgi:hypothetical protein
MLSTRKSQVVKLRPQKDCIEAAYQQLLYR